jgi:hypothetical protein
MDRALWISWYNLPDSGRDAYLSWAHGTYMPAMVKRPGVLYAAHFKSVVPEGVPGGGRLSHTKDSKLGTGNDYIMIVGAEDAHAFGRRRRARSTPACRRTTRRCSPTRKGERVNIMTDEARRDGLDAKKREAKAALSPCIQLGTFQAGSADGRRGRDARMVRAMPHAQHDAASRLRRRAQDRLRFGLGEARRALRVRVAGRSATSTFPRTRRAALQDEALTDRLVRTLLHAPGSPNVAERIAFVMK